VKNVLPSWFKQELPDNPVKEKARLLDTLDVHTVCVEAHCPNFASCFKNSRLTFLILGDTCTRQCRFCAIKKSAQTKLALDSDEPRRVAQAVAMLGISYVILTSVTRDDLPDGGAGIFSQTIRAIRGVDRRIKVEVLIPDFGASAQNLEKIISAVPCIIAHNLETVPRLYQEVRPLVDYQLSLKVLSKIKQIKRKMITKSSLLLGMGERKEEVIGVMQDLRDSFCDILVLGQYLAPSIGHYPVKEYISVAQFQEYSKMALKLGFKSVLAHPKARTSYQAKEVFLNAAGI